MGANDFNLPPGFRFHPTDEELVLHFLHRKAAVLPCHPNIIPDLDLHHCDPWDLDGKAMGEGKKRYFYSRRTQSKVTETGYWQSIGVEDPVFSSEGEKIGMKSCSAFYIGEPWEGLKTDWIMHEYRALGSFGSGRHSKNTDYSKWVVCQVYENGDEDDDRTELSWLDEVLVTMDDLDEISFPSY